MITKFYTKTLALLYAKQGHYDDAEKGFRALLEKEPDNDDYKKELETILSMKSDNGRVDLVGLFTEWISLIKKNKSVQP